jgi:hypothetical protein
MSSTFFYSRPDEAFVGGTGTGAVDAGFDANWLVDGKPGRPVKKTGGAASWTVSGTARTVGIVAVINHNLSAGSSIQVIGPVSATLTVPTTPGDGIQLNPYAAVTPGSTTAFSIGVSGTNPVIGEFWAGQRRQLERSIRLEATFDVAPQVEWAGEFTSIPPYDMGITWRILRGQTYCGATGKLDIDAWWTSTRRGVLPTLIVPRSEINDAWLVTFSYSATPLKLPSTDDELWRIDFEFTELPRSRW